MVEKQLTACTASEYSNLSRSDFLQAIKENEGRTLMCECSADAPLYLPEGISNAELLAGMGSDLLILNHYDVTAPLINGITADEENNLVKEAGRLTGRPAGIRLQAIPDKAPMRKTYPCPPGQEASPAAAVKAIAQGFRILMVLADAKTGRDTLSVNNCLKELKKACGDRIILAVGKLHADSYADEDAILSIDEINGFANNGADLIVLPAPGTIPCAGTEWAASRIRQIHYRKKLAVTAVNEEGLNADSETLRMIARQSKLAGSDLHYLLCGRIGDPEAVRSYSIALKGYRNTCFRTCASINR